VVRTDISPVLWQFLIKNAASPAGEPQNQAGSFSPPQAAKFVRTIFNIEHISVKVNDLWAASLRSAAKLNGNFQSKLNFRFCLRRSRK
jgi:hypothetical protein